MATEFLNDARKEIEGRTEDFYKELKAFYQGSGEAEAVEDRYRLSVEVKMRLTQDTGSKIRNRYEKLRLELEGRREIVTQHGKAVREYKCPNCGGSVDILGGGVCDYCNAAVSEGFSVFKIEDPSEYIADEEEDEMFYLVICAENAPEGITVTATLVDENWDPVQE